MSSAVLPNEGSWNGYGDDAVDPSVPKNNAQPNANYLAGLENTKKAGVKTLKDSVYRGVSLNRNRNAFIAQIAKTKYAGIDGKAALLKATKDYQAMVNDAANKIASQQPYLSKQEVQVVAQEQVLASKNSLKNIVGNSLGLAANAGKKALKSAIQKEALAALVAALPAILIGCAICLVVLLVIGLTQTFASEDKWKSFTNSANLVFCAGGTDTKKLTQCLIDQKTKEYLGSDPATEK